MAPHTETKQSKGLGVLFGYPISHSLSPLLHQTVFDSFNNDWNFSLLESKDMDQFLQILKDPRCFGEYGY
jgi:quinate dehydrogenase